MEKMALGKQKCYSHLVGIERIQRERDEDVPFLQILYRKNGLGSKNHSFARSTS